MGAAALSVHPRLRGELSIALARVVPICRFIPAYAGNSNRTAKERELQVGSSPLTRGTHGVIPNSRAIAAVHPRLRGELNIRTADAMAPTGSSPLTRGTPYSYMRRHNKGTVHPRLRGELWLAESVHRQFNGSSPLTRGTQHYSDCTRHRRRFIPAYAGNSVDFLPGALKIPVHPRLRGELPNRMTAPGYCRRFIPAYAGNSYSLQIEEPSIAVHPRLRGELGYDSKNIMHWLRFIPAYAGNSIKAAVSASKQTVHPRLRGELKLTVLTLRSETGSSPLTRGTRLEDYEEGVECRFIPAYAGNSCFSVFALNPSTVHPRLRGELGYFSSF